MGDILSKEMIDDHNKYRLIEQVSNRLKEGEYSIFDEFYVFKTKEGKDSLSTTNHGINNYKYVYDAAVPQMYIVFFVPKSIPNQYMITAEYSKFDYGWKLNKLDLGPYAVNGKSGAELFKLAQEKYANKCLAVAFTISQLAVECAKPADGWEYPTAKELSDFADKTSEETNKKYEFPYTVTSVGTQPWIFRIYNKTMPDGVFPDIYYISHIKLSDTNAIKKENTSLQKVIGKVFPGIDKDNKYIIYSAFKNMPDGSGSFDHFDMTEKLKP